MLSYIQQLIITKFITAETLRYSEARPEGTENDLYNYHLQFLVKKGFLKKEAESYSLTNKGKVYVQQIDSVGEFKEYFKFSVIVNTVRNVNNSWEILSHKRLRHPYYGVVGNGISGKVHYGERIEDAASRKLKEETGLIGTCKFLGVIRKIRRDKENNVIEDTLYHYCYNENPKGALVEKNEFGENFWSGYKQAIAFDKENILAGKHSEDVIKRIHKRNFDLFYFVEEVKVEKY